MRKNWGRAVAGSVALLMAGLLLAGCKSPADQSAGQSPPPGQTTSSDRTTASDRTGTSAGRPSETDRSTPRTTGQSSAAASVSEPVYVETPDAPQAPPEQRPAMFVAGGVGHIRLTRINWQGWGSPVATGTGTLEIDRCEPSCATGGADKFPGKVVLTTVKTVHGRHQYTRFTMTSPGLGSNVDDVTKDQSINNE